MDSSMQKFGSKIITPNMCVVVLKFHYEKWQEGAIDFKAFLVLVIFRKFIWSKAHFAQSKTFEVFCPKAEISFSEKNKFTKKYILELQTVAWTVTALK